MDVTPESNLQDAAYYQSLIGVLRWIVELGRSRYRLQNINDINDVILLNIAAGMSSTSIVLLFHLPE